MSVDKKTIQEHFIKNKKNRYCTWLIPKTM